jgi:hypothetical protein
MRNEGSNGLCKRGAYRGIINDKDTLQGNIAEHGNNVYQYGTRDQGEKVHKTTEAIGDYVGREYRKEMKLLVKNQKENEFKEPVMPGKEKAKKPSVMKKYEKIRRAQRKDICDCEGTMQQCTLDMKNNKVDSLKGHNSIEVNDDVISKTAGQRAIS